MKELEKLGVVEATLTIWNAQNKLKEIIAIKKDGKNEKILEATQEVFIDLEKALKWLYALEAGKP